MRKQLDKYTKYFAVEAEGGRVGFMTCRLCGAAIMLSNECNAPQIHTDWHEDEIRKEQFYA